LPGTPRSGAALPGNAFPGDPADRLLYATALELTVPFVMKDKRVRAYAKGSRTVRVIW
jgi:PIN domain nuclease of toxin-antitoxin system